MIEVEVLHAPDFQGGVKKPVKTFLNPQYIVQVIPMASTRVGETKHKSDVDIVFRCSIQMHDTSLFLCTARAETVVEAMRRRP